MNAEIAQTAEHVLKSLDMWLLPVDPLAIAKEEQILLAPGTYGDRFDARIEYFRPHRRFGIYYRDTGRTVGRVRFSLSHELGHFYLPHHRERLIQGRMHNSTSEYRSRDPFESEADEFAANLLMPRDLFTREVRRFRQRVCDIQDLKKLAERLGVSVTSAAIRYCECGIEPTLAVFSEDGIVQWTYCSEEMKSLGCWYVKTGTAIPEGSQTAKLLEKLDDGPTDEIVGHRIAPSLWFDWPKCRWLYEEAVQLGNRVLTWMTVDE